MRQQMKSWASHQTEGWLNTKKSSVGSVSNRKKGSHLSLKSLFDVDALDNSVSMCACLGFWVARRWFWLPKPGWISFWKMCSLNKKAHKGMTHRKKCMWWHTSPAADCSGSLGMLVSSSLGITVQQSPAGVAVKSFHTLSSKKCYF